jgi:hypothetical protein
MIAAAAKYGRSVESRFAACKINPPIAIQIGDSKKKIQQPPQPSFELLFLLML